MQNVAITGCATSSSGQCFFHAAQPMPAMARAAPVHPPLPCPSGFTTCHTAYGRVHVGSPGCQKYSTWMMPQISSTAVFQCANRYGFTAANSSTSAPPEPATRPQGTPSPVRRALINTAETSTLESNTPAYFVFIDAPSAATAQHNSRRAVRASAST